MIMNRMKSRPGSSSSSAARKLESSPPFPSMRTSPSIDCAATLQRGGRSRQPRALKELLLAEQSDNYVVGPLRRSLCNSEELLELALSLPPESRLDLRNRIALLRADRGALFLVRLGDALCDAQRESLVALDLLGARLLVEQGDCLTEPAQPLLLGFLARVVALHLRLLGDESVQELAVAMLLAGFGERLRQRPGLTKRPPARSEERDHPRGRRAFAYELPLLVGEVGLAGHGIFLSLV